MVSRVPSKVPNGYLSKKVKGQINFS